MRHIRLLPFFFLAISFLFSCSNKINPLENEPADKFEPYDQFAFQRSFPDRDFDWKGWKNAMVDIRAEVSAQAKGSDCDGNASNWTIQGPANVAGRCNTLAVKPNDENTVLAGFAGGGIFKTTDGGINWYPVFDDHLELAIGVIVFDPSNPNIAYCGTGDPNIPSIVFNGDGVYKSVDAGETWTYLGLSEVGIISKIAVHPNNPNTLVVASMGNPFVRDEMRGIYKSTNGGQTWQQVLFISKQAGASDLVQSPTNPNILYASFWDRIRNNTESILYGENAKVYKSTDGGDTWALSHNGLPTSVNGRTGLAISQQNPDKVYIVYIDSLSTTGGLYKTIDGGDNWTAMNVGALEDACSNFGWFFAKIRINPKNDEELYFLAILLYRKLAGSSSWIVAGGGHADCHDLVFTPSGRRYWANDGGVYRNNMGQSVWTKCKNLPTTQFYRTTFNPHEPNLYWGGAQDNGIQKGVGGANINNWTAVFSADGFKCAFDPNDPQTFWVEIQNGTIHKTTDGGSSWQFGSANLGSTDRCSWDAPFFMSQYGPVKLFSATYRVYVSSGSGWAPISQDLTDGIIYGPRFHTVSALAESPKLAEKMMAGTTDGNVWKREPTSNWVNITGSLPDRYVTCVQLSPTQSQRLYVTHSGFRNDEYIPHVHRSDDNGATWVDISSDLPQMPVNDIYILPGHADSLLFVATDAGVYFTKNSGLTWSRLGGNMPVIPVFDLESNPVRNELVAATFARGIWTFSFDSVFVQQPTVSVQISGSITTELGEPVSNVQLGNVKSQSDGMFQANIPGCAPLSLAPYRNDNPLNGITTFDLVLISKHILGIEPLGSPYKMLAADANRSNSITTFDIVALRKLILGIDDTIAGNTSWRFVKKDFVFPNPSNPFLGSIPQVIESQLQTAALSGLNFTAIKVGDVNNTAVPNAIGPNVERTLGTWPLAAQDRAFQENEKVEIVFQGTMLDIAALQFSLNFDVEALAFESIIPLVGDISIDNFGTNRTKNGLISVAISANQGETIGKTELFKVVFKAKKTGKLSQCLHLGNWPTSALAFRENGTALLPTLWEDAPPQTLSFAPNPFGTAGTWFESPITDATLEIFDIQGKMVFSKSVSSTSRVHLAQEVFPHPGVYYWRLNNGEQTGRLVYAP